MADDVCTQERVITAGKKLPFARAVTSPRHGTDYQPTIAEAVELQFVVPIRRVLAHLPRTTTSINFPSKLFPLIHLIRCSRLLEFSNIDEIFRLG